MLRNAAMDTEPQPQQTQPEFRTSDAFILVAIERLAADSRSNHEQSAADSRSNYDRLTADSRSNHESIRADIRQLYYLNILTLLTALGALITGLFTLLTR